jgi:hypothetical protein
MAIVGLSAYEMLRDFLYLRMRGARFGDASIGGEPVAEPADAAADEPLELLTEIRDEIRALRQRLAGAGP